MVNVQYAVSDVIPGFQPSDEHLVSDVIWGFLIQGILALGPGNGTLELPHFHLTEYGKRCLKADSILPHDPDRYMVGLLAQLSEPLDPVVEQYVAESLGTFLGGHFMASTVMLGVASEICIDALCDAFHAALSTKEKQDAFENKIKRAGRSIKSRFDVLRAALLGVSLPPALSDALDIQLSAVFTLIRYSRNDARHATGQDVNRDVAHANLLLFPGYCSRIYSLISHFRNTSV
ncbi:MAG TPA: hypothetical protein PLC98_25145 [Anaerolineales bacterium]|nr:hypothetical protein [Anaerolineales bacterium]